MGRNDFPDQFRNHNMIQTCSLQLNCNAVVGMLSFNPITFNNYASHFNCTLVGRASESMLVSTLSYSF